MRSIHICNIIKSTRCQTIHSLVVLGRRQHSSLEFGLISLVEGLYISSSPSYPPESRLNDHCSRPKLRLGRQYHYQVHSPNYHTLPT
uniref:Ovule protein n=1 Tax=Rodentolepis nana TaxID=102285 RepID=A0A0R3TZX2_RODNA